MKWIKISLTNDFKVGHTQNVKKNNLKEQQQKNAKTKPDENSLEFTSLVLHYYYLLFKS